MAFVNGKPVRNSSSEIKFCEQERTDSLRNQTGSDLENSFFTSLNSSHFHIIISSPLGLRFGRFSLRAREFKVLDFSLGSASKFQLYNYITTLDFPSFLFDLYSGLSLVFTSMKHL